MAIEFQKYGKTPRLFRDITISEKIDGTNSAVIIEEVEEFDEPSDFRLACFEVDGRYYEVAAQSRNRLITPGKTTDNHGFALFVQTNAEALFDALGPGRHYGEFWGKGIQGRYVNQMAGVKGFALFNTAKHKGLHLWLPAGDGATEVLLETTHVLYEGPFSEQKIREVLTELKKTGSWISPMSPAEGIVVYHTQSGQVYKVTLDNEDKGKWEL